MSQSAVLTSGPGGRWGEIVVHGFAAVELCFQRIHHDLDEDPDLATKRLLVVHILQNKQSTERLAINHVTLTSLCMPCKR